MVHKLTALLLIHVQLFHWLEIFLFYLWKKYIINRLQYFVKMFVTFTYKEKQPFFLLYSQKKKNVTQRYMIMFKNYGFLPHSCKMYFKMLSSSSKLPASHIERPRRYSGSFLSLFSRAAGSWPCVLPAPVDSLLLISWRAFRRCSTFLSAFRSSSTKVSPLPDLQNSRNKS